MERPVRGLASKTVTLWEHIFLEGESTCTNFYAALVSHWLVRRASGVVNEVGVHRTTMQT